MVEPQLGDARYVLPSHSSKFQENLQKKGYYFATAQETSQKEMATRIGKILHQRGVLQQAEPKSIDEAAMDKLLEDWGQKGLGWYLFGNNSRATAKKAHKELGWQPSNRTLWDYLESDIDLSLNA